MFYKNSLLTLMLASVFSHAEVTSKVIGLQECAPLPLELAPAEKPLDCLEPGAKILLMFSGEAILGFEEGSLYFDTISLDGNEYRVGKLDEPIYTITSQPVASVFPQKGKYFFTEISIRKLPFGHLNKVKAEGHLNLLTGSRLIQNKTLTIQNTEELNGLTLGPIKLLNLQPVFRAISPAGAPSVSPYGSDTATTVYGTAAVAAIASAHLDGQLMFSVEGYNASVTRFEVSEGGHILENSGLSSSNGAVKTLIFSGYNGGPITISIDYWGDTKSQTVAFTIN